MAEEKKGHVKVTFEVNINEAIMDLIRENMREISQMMQMWQSRREEKSKDPVKKHSEEDESSHHCRHHAIWRA
ncbi:MAG TPA: hypothetical protein VMT42_05125 [candidate division Zixibacteria bacterium]|nr:hypothetical protein [candidate division Zixibacteria bacterium]